MASVRKAKGVTLPKGGVTYSYKFDVAGVTYRGSTGFQEENQAIAYVDARKREIKARNVLRAVGKGLVPNINRDLPLLFVADDFWRLRGCHDVNKDNTRKIMARVVREIGPDTMMSDINDLVLIEFVNRLKTYVSLRTNREYEGSTVNQYTRMLRRIYTFAGDRDRGKLGLPLSILDWADVWEPENQRIRQISYDEEARMVADGSDYATVVRFGAICGLRKTNLVTLMWSQVNLDNREITVQQKRSKSVKKKNRPHVIHMTDEMFGILQAQLPHREAGEGQVWTLISDRTGYNKKAKRMFYRGLRTPMRVTGFDRWFSRRAKKLSLDITIHDLRRTTGGRVLSSTGSIEFASKILGHSSPVITAKIYAHALPRDLREAMEVASSRNATPLWVAQAKANMELDGLTKS